MVAKLIHVGSIPSNYAKGCTVTAKLKAHSNRKEATVGLHSHNYALRITVYIAVAMPAGGGSSRDTFSMYISVHMCRVCPSVIPYKCCCDADHVRSRGMQHYHPHSDTCNQLLLNTNQKNDTQ